MTLTQRDHALAIFQAALTAADPARAVRKHWNINPADYRNIYVVGAGKAGAAMAQAVERKLGKRITAGLINVKYGHTAPLKRIELNECGHPVPDEAGVRGAERIAALASQAGEGDLVLCLISGGASSLLPLPAESLSLAAKQDVTRQLLACGADIHEMNAVRKHLSRIKGGQLAAMAEPARVITLILSDVIGDNLDVIGSGPTAPDASTVEDARAVLAKFGIETDAERFLHETPKVSAAANIIVGSNRQALAAAAKKARSLGYRTLLLASTIEGETRDVARMHAALAREIRQSGNPLNPPACLISGGETTVTLRGPGKGGRNQEFALAAAIDIGGVCGITILSCGTDGTDGPTDAAGGVVNGTTFGDGARKALADNDSYTYLQSRDALVITGPTHTNVMDVHVVLVGPAG
ncbi:MAG: glycerate 2-kinase [Bryobacterales bacterium]|nr:glycerate 2-kinase [Bryobacterales bacterium]